MFAHMLAASPTASEEILHASHGNDGLSAGSNGLAEDLLHARGPGKPFRQTLQNLLRLIHKILPKFWHAPVSRMPTNSSVDQGC
jgi:hypothetical protein